MPRECRHIHHEVQPQQNIWRGAEFKKVQAAQVFCADCKVWLYDKLINWDLVPLNKTARMEARIDDSRPGKRAAKSARQSDPPRRAHAV